MPRENGSENVKRPKIREEDVDEALIQRAARELGITVPIRSWNMAGDSRIVLHLAYGGSVLWPPDHGTERELQHLRQAGQLAVDSPDGKPWSFNPDDALATEGGHEPPSLPIDNLDNHLKAELQSFANAYGFQSTSDYVRKDELVEALTWLREQLKE